MNNENVTFLVRGRYSREKGPLSESLHKLMNSLKPKQLILFLILICFFFGFLLPIRPSFGHPCLEQQYVLDFLSGFVSSLHRVLYTKYGQLTTKCLLNCMVTSMEYNTLTKLCFFTGVHVFRLVYELYRYKLDSLLQLAVYFQLDHPVWYFVKASHPFRISGLIGLSSVRRLELAFNFDL